MKKAFMVVSLLIMTFVLASQEISAQTTSSQSPWNGPRWSSVNVVHAAWNWVTTQGLMPDEDGEWVKIQWRYPGKGIWIAYITWYNNGEYGAQELQVRSNGEVTEL